MCIKFHLFSFIFIYSLFQKHIDFLFFAAFRMLATKYTANPSGNSNGRLNIVIRDPKGNLCSRILSVLVLVLGVCLVISLIVNGWLGHKVMGMIILSFFLFLLHKQCIVGTLDIMFIREKKTLKITGF